MSKYLKKDLDKKTKINLIIFIVILLLVIGYISWDIFFSGPLSNLLNNKDHITELIKSHGFFAPTIYIALQALQTIIAPIPGNIVSAAGGFIFGWWGVIWTLIGSGLGAFVVFYITKRFGRPLVEKIVKKPALDKFDFIFHGRAKTVIFLIFLIPGLPDDIVCYIAGLTNVPIKKLLTIYLVGRLPSIVVNNYLGAGLGEENLIPVIIASLITVILLVIIAWQRENIVLLLKLQNSKPPKK